MKEKYTFTETAVAIIVALPVAILKWVALSFAIYGGFEMIGHPIGKGVAFACTSSAMMITALARYKIARDNVRRFEALEAKVSK